MFQHTKRNQKYQNDKDQHVQFSPPSSGRLRVTCFFCVRDKTCQNPYGLSNGTGWKQPYFSRSVCFFKQIRVLMLKQVHSSLRVQVPVAKLQRSFCFHLQEWDVPFPRDRQGPQSPQQFLLRAEWIGIAWPSSGPSQLRDNFLAMICYKNIHPSYSIGQGCFQNACDAIGIEKQQLYL